MRGSLINNLSSVVLAILLGIIIWSVATGEENPSKDGVYAGVPVQVVNLPDGLVILQQSRTTVTVKVRGPVASVDQLSSSSFRAEADLQKLGVGLHEVPIELKVADPQVDVVSYERTVGIRLEPLKARTFQIHSDILDSVPLGFSARIPVVVPPQATVSGPGVLVDQVADIVADVFLRGAKAPFDREVALVARDTQGTPVKGVTITPAAVTVSVQIEQRVGYKDVSIKAALKGAPAPGYWVSNIGANPSTLTVAGSADALAKIPGYVETQPVDVTGAKADLTRRLTLVLPDGVSVLNNEGVEVRVSVTPILGGQTVRRAVIVQGLRPGHTATISPPQVDVILSGPVPTLQDLAPDDVQVVLDVSDKIAGTYQLKPRAPVMPDALKVQSIVPDTVQVTITENRALFTPTAPITSSQILTTTRSISETLPPATTRPITRSLPLTPTLSISVILPTPTRSK